MALLNPQDNYKGSGGGDRNGRGGGGGGGRDGGYNDYGSKSGGDRRGGDRNDRNGGGGASEVFIKVPGDKAGIVIGKGNYNWLFKLNIFILNALFRAHNDLAHDQFKVN